MVNTLRIPAQARGQYTRMVNSSDPGELESGVGALGNDGFNELFSARAPAGTSKNHQVRPIPATDRAMCADRRRAL